MLKAIRIFTFLALGLLAVADTVYRVKVVTGTYGAGGETYCLTNENTKEKTLVFVFFDAARRAYNLGHPTGYVKLRLAKERVFGRRVLLKHFVDDSIIGREHHDVLFQYLSNANNVTTIYDGPLEYPGRCEGYNPYRIVLSSPIPV